MEFYLENHHLRPLLNASWQAGIMILLVLGAQQVFGRFLSPRWRYTLWLLVVVRLLLPVSVPSPVSLFNYLHLKSVSDSVAKVTGSTSDADAGVVKQMGLAEPVTASTTANSYLAGLPWFLLLWAGGAFTLAVYLVVTHYRISRRVVGCRPLTDAPSLNLLEDCKELMGVQVPVTLVETPAVGSPSLFGFVRPRLLLPAGLRQNFSAEELRYVFLHELSHIKRRDILTSWLMTVLQIVHWFNPLVWLAFHRMRVDRELACDALALSYAQESENQPYGRTIIKLLEGFGCSQWAPSLAGTVENKNQLKERISMIAKFKKTNRGVALAACLLIGLGLATLTDAQTGQTVKDEGLTAAAEDAQSAPQIISTSPEVGAKDVPADLKEITVTFDQDMAGGFSWTGGGPNFPQSPEGQKANWRDKRTCVLPVKLQRGQYYRVGINSTSYQNFRSMAGIPAKPSAIYFTTEGADATMKTQTAIPEIVKLEPVNGAQDVSPSVTELRVTFNVPMAAGFSWTGGGPQFPKITEGKKPSWSADRKTCILPVTLTPGTTYRLGLNSPSHKNFQSAAGVPLKPVLYTFETSGER